MMKKLLLLTLFLPMSVTATPRKMKGDDLSNMIIEGQNRLRVTSELPPLRWNPDLYRDAPAYFRDHGVVASLTPPALEEPPVTFETRSDSEKPAAPWIDTAIEPPVLSLHVKPEEERRRVEWTFLVRDSNGREFYTHKKRGALPERIDWPGFGDNRKPLQAGFDYAYSLSIVDEAGNPQRFSGKPFRVPCFRFQRGNRSITLVHPEAIFASVSDIRVSRDGRAQLVGIKDSLRRRYDKKLDITVYDTDPKFALARANVIRDYLVQTLDLPHDQVLTQGFDTTKGDGYRYVEIISR